MFAEYLVGVSYLLLIGGAFGFTAVEIRRQLLPTWNGSLARLAEVVVGAGAFVATSELLGLIGSLTRVGLLIATLAVAITTREAGVHLRGRRPVRLEADGVRAEVSSDPAPPSPCPPRWAVAVALGVATITVLHWSGGVRDSLDYGIYRQDSTWYHLPIAAGFFQTGSTWSLQFTDPMALTAWFYPMNSELLHTVGMLAFGNDLLSPFLNLLWMALALLAAWCIGRPFGLGPLTLIAAALVLDSEMMQAQAGNAPSDTAGIFFLLATAAILLNADAAARLRETRLGARPLLLAALAAGLAVGTKITLLVPIAVIAVGVVVVTGRGRRGRVSAIWLGGLLVSGGYWYVRNLWHAGNPLPWIALGPLGGPDQLRLYPRPPHSVASYAADLPVWIHDFAPALTRTLGHLWPLMLAAAAAGLVLALSRPQPVRRVLAAAAIGAALAYAFIPVSASGSPSHPAGFESNLRYLAPTLALALTLFALELGRSLRGKRLATVGMVAIFAVNAVTSPDWQAKQVPIGIVILILLAAPIAIAEIRRRRSSAAGIAGLAAICLALIIGLGYPTERNYLRDRYLPTLAPPADNPGFRATPQWGRVQGWARHIHDARIGIVGPPAAFGQYVFYGSDLSNEVDYIGKRGPRGAYRPIEGCGSWRRAINRGGYGYVVITPASAIGPGPLPQEMLWMTGDPAAHLILRAGPSAVYRIEGPLQPHGCTAHPLPPVIRVPGGGFTVPGSQLSYPAQ